jgi:hypothetical protein
VFETAREWAFLNAKLFLQSLLYARRLENNYANLISGSLEQGMERQ